MNIVATGAGKDSNINIEGSDISGKQGTTLMADNQVNIQASEQNHQERSTNKSSGFNAGVALKLAVVLPQVLQLVVITGKATAMVMKLLMLLAM